MQILKKKNNSYRIILEIFLGLFVLSGCSNSTIVEPIITTTPIIKECDYLNLENKTVKLTNDLEIYNIDNKVVGIMKADNVINLSEVNNCYIAIKDSDYYIKSDEVEVVHDDKIIEDSLIPYSKNLITKDNFILYDFFGRNRYEFNSSMNFELYVLRDNISGNYGVKFSEDILYINENDIKSIEENDNIINVELAQELPVMMYHFFYDKANGESKRDNNWLEINDFEEQLKFLNSNNYNSLNMKEIYLFTKGLAQIPDKSYGLTIDDGNESVYRLAYPLLLENNIKATNFVIGGWMGPYLPYEFIEMRLNNVEAQSHSFLMHEGGCPNSKGKLVCSDYDTVFQDTLMSLQYVDNGFSYCYPFGQYSESNFEPMQKAGVKLAFTTEYGKITQGNNLMKLPRIRISADDSIITYESKLK